MADSEREYARGFIDGQAKTDVFRKRLWEAEKQNAELLAALKEVAGCFAAAEVEGLTAILDTTTDSALKDLVERRLLWANEAAAKILAALQPSTQEVSNER